MQAAPTKETVIDRKRIPETFRSFIKRARWHGRPALGTLPSIPGARRKGGFRPTPDVLEDRKQRREPEMAECGLAAFDHSPPKADNARVDRVGRANQPAGRMFGLSRMPPRQI